jgi:hypothetical protein
MLGRRLFTLLLILVLSASNAAVCAGWMPTPEARMACCSEGGGCPMHKSGSHEPGSHRMLTQSEADRCCAASERDNSSQSIPTFPLIISSAVLGAAVALPTSVPTLVLSAAWRIVAPVPTTPVDKHVLLSVFLV